MNEPPSAPRDGLRPPKDSLLHSFRHAFDGLAYVVRCERNMRIHLMIATAVMLLGLWLDLSATDWLLILVAITLVLSGEMLNTVVELIVDLVTREQHPLAKHAKDVAAAAILLASGAAALVGLLTLGPKLLLRLGL
jgi:diacylglycerol kinase (ATP)